MALKADAEGFLLANAPFEVDPRGYAKTLEILRAVRGDTAAIRSALEGTQREVMRSRAAVPGRASNASFFSDAQVASLARGVATAVRSGRAVNPSTERVRGPDGRFVASPARGEGASPSQDASQPKRSSTATARPATPARGAGGRFKGSGDDDDRGGASYASSKLSDAAESLKDTASGIADTAEAVDPSVTAAKELGEVVAPIMRPIGNLFKKGFGALFGGDEKQEKKANGWRSKIHKELKEMNRRPAAGGGSGLGWMASVLGPMLGGLTGSLGGILTGILAKLFGPLRGALAKAALPIAGMVSAIKGFNTSTEEYAQRMGVELNGNLAQALGVRFVGVLGDLGNTITFGLADEFGRYISPAVNDTFEAIGNAWDGFLADAGKVWNDAIGTVKAWLEKLYNLGGDTKEYVKEKAGNAWDATKSFFGGGSAGNKKALFAEMGRAGITNPHEQAAFLAQMDHESGGFRSLEESFNYRNADRLMGVSGSARKHGRAAVEAAMSKGPEAVAELMYGGRMGNTSKGDAYKFRGRGFTQLTGKANYEEASKALGVDLVSNPDLAADPEMASKIATWYWKKSGAGAAARSGDLTRSRKLVNGGLNGMADVQSKYDGYLAMTNAGNIGIDGKPRASYPNAPVPLATAQIAGSRAVSTNNGGSRVTPPMMATHSAPPAAQPVQSPIGSNSKGGSRTTVTLRGQVGQNLSDRSIAHVATGGIGGV